MSKTSRLFQHLDQPIPRSEILPGESSSSIRSLFSGPSQVVDYEQQFFNPSSSISTNQPRETRYPLIDRIQAVDPVTEFIRSPISIDDTPPEKLKEILYGLGEVKLATQLRRKEYLDIIYLSGKKYDFPSNPEQYTKYKLSRFDIPPQVISQIAIQLGLNTDNFVDLDQALGLIPQTSVDINGYGLRIGELSNQQLATVIKSHETDRSKLLQMVRNKQLENLSTLRDTNLHQLSTKEIDELEYAWSVRSREELERIQRHQPPPGQFIPLIWPSHDKLFQNYPGDLDQLTLPQIEEFQTMRRFGFNNYRSINPNLNWDAIVRFMDQLADYEKNIPTYPSRSKIIRDYLLNPLSNPFLANLDRLNPKDYNWFLENQINRIFLTPEDIQHIVLTVTWMRLNNVPVYVQTHEVQDRLYPELRKILNGEQRYGITTPRNKPMKELYQEASQLGVLPYGRKPFLKAKIYDNIWRYKTSFTHDPQLDQLIRRLSPNSTGEIRWARDPGGKDDLIKQMFYHGHLDALRDLIQTDDIGQIQEIYQHFRAEVHTGTSKTLNMGWVRGMIKLFSEGRLGPGEVPFLDYLSSLSRDTGIGVINQMISNIDILNKQDIHDLALGLLFYQINLPPGLTRRGLNPPDIDTLYKIHELGLGYFDEIMAIVGDGPTDLEFDQALDYLQGKTDIIPNNIRKSIALMVRDQHRGVWTKRIYNIKYQNNYIQLIDNLTKVGLLDISTVPRRIAVKSRTEAEIQKISRRLRETLRKPTPETVQQLASEIPEYPRIYVPPGFDLWTFEYQLSGRTKDLLRPLISALSQVKLVTQGNRSRL